VQAAAAAVETQAGAALRRGQRDAARLAAELALMHAAHQVPFLYMSRFVVLFRY
jgi:hypothetical protein